MRIITTQYGLSDESLEESYVTTIGDRLDNRDTEDAYVSIADVVSREEAEQQRAGYAYLTDDTEASSVWVEGELMQVVSLDATYAKGDAAINAWVDAAGVQHTGSVSVNYLPDGTPVARCAKCNQSLRFTLTEGQSERYAMEQFTLACISHGHNHQSTGYWVDATKDRDANGALYEVTPRYKVVRSQTRIGDPVAEAIRPDTAHRYNVALIEQELNALAK